MKIKQTRQVRLDELLPLVWSNKFDYLVFMSDNNGIIRFDMNGKIRQANGIKYDDLFTITEEVEVTEGTKLNVHEIYHYGNNDFNATTHFNISVNEVLNMGTKEPLFIYLQNEDGSIGELIWSKECGLVD